MKTKQKCTGESLINKKNFGGHMEDYLSDPNKPFPYPKDCKWVPVSQTFKKD